MRPGAHRAPGGRHPRRDVDCRDDEVRRSPRAGRSPPRSSRRPSPSGPRRPPPRRSRRSPSSSRRRLSEPGAKMTDTSGARRGVPLTSIRPSVFSGERAGFAAVSDWISMPSRPISTSARSTAPTACPGGTSPASTVPLGWRAPAARHVHDPSPVWLVNSMSMRRDMRRTRYLAWHPCPMPSRDRHPVTWHRTSAGLREPPGRATSPCSGAGTSRPLQEDPHERGHRAARVGSLCRHTRSSHPGPHRGDSGIRRGHGPCVV